MADEFFAEWKEVEQEHDSQAAKMEKAAIAYIKVITKDTDASAVFFNEWRHLSEPHLSEFLAMKNDYEGRFIKILKDSVNIENDDNGVIVSIPNYDIGLPGAGLMIWHIDVVGSGLKLC